MHQGRWAVDASHRLFAHVADAGLGVERCWVGQAGQGYTTTVYEGQIKAVKIVKCGLQPGLCEGSIILARQGSEDTQVDVRIGTWIKRGANFLTIEDLRIGDQSQSPDLPFTRRSEPARGDSRVHPTVTPQYLVRCVFPRPTGSFPPRPSLPSLSRSPRGREPHLEAHTGAYAPTTFMGCVAYE